MLLTKRQRRIAAKNAARILPAGFNAIDLNECAISTLPPGMTRAFRNNRYTVMVFDNSPTTHGPAIRAMVQNHQDTAISFHWRELQKIKNELFGPETIAVEYYPKESELTDLHNIYWLWIYPQGVLPVPVFSVSLQRPGIVLFFNNYSL